MGVKKENEYLKDNDMSGQEKTIKTPKMVENIEKRSNHISKGSRSICLPDSLIYAFTL